MNNPTRAAGAVNPTIDAPASYTNTPARSPPPGKRATTDAPAPGRPYEYGDATEFTTTSPLKPAATGCPESTTSNDTNDPNSPRPSAEFSVNPKSSNTYGSADTTGTALNRNFEPTTVGDTDDEINTTSNPDSTPTDTALSSTTDTDNPASTNTSRNARSANGGPAEPATNNTRPPTADTDTGDVDTTIPTKRNDAATRAAIDRQLERPVRIRATVVAVQPAELRGAGADATRRRHAVTGSGRASTWSLLAREAQRAGN